MSDVEIQLADGGLATVPEQDLAQALNAGATIPTPEAARARELDTAGAKAMSFITGADESLGGLGTSLGLAAHELGYGTSSTDSAAKEIRAQRDANAGYGIAGGLVGSLAMPGVGLELGAESALGRVGTLAAEGALDGAVAGAGHALTEDALGNPEANGEMYFSGEVAKGLLLGGAVGLGLGALGEGARSGLSRLGRDLTGTRAAGSELMSGYRQAQGRVEEAMALGLDSREASKLVEQAGNAGKAVSLGDQTAGRAFDAYAGVVARDNPELQRLLRTEFEDGASRAAKAETRLDDMTRAVSSPTDKLFQVEDALYDASISAKGSKMRELVDPSKAVEAHDAAVNIIRQSRDFLQPFEQSANRLGAEGFSNAFRKEIETLEQAVLGTQRKVTAAEERASAKLARIDEDLAVAAQARVEPAELAKLQKAREEAQRSVEKAGMGTMWKGAETGKISDPADVFMALDNFKRNTGKLQRSIGNADGSVKGMFENLYANVLQAPLEDASIWGEKAANAQREVNATWTQRLATRDKFAEYFTTQFGKDGFDRLYRTDPAKLKGFFRNISGSENDLKREAFESYLAGLANALDKTELHYGSQAAFAEGRSAIDSVRKSFEKASDEAKVLEKLSSQRLSEGEGLGGALGLVADTFTRPLKTAERLAALRNGVDRLSGGVRKSVDALFGTGAARGVGEALPRAKILERAEEVRRLASNPQAFMDRVSERVSGLSSAAPKHAAAITSAASRGLMHLMQHAPVGTSSSALFGDKKKRYTDSEVDSFGRRLAAFENPEGTIELALSGRLRRDHVETLQATHPAVYEQIRQDTMRHFDTLEKAGKLNTVPYQRQLSIGILLDIPVNDTLDPSFVQLLQSTKTAATPTESAAPDQKPVRRRVEIDKAAMTTESQRLEAGGTQ